ncbi:tetratricopeptide repeat protein [Actinoallomurus iriomotensis]|nr:tetratricopeptide repeat protein [Actinoallomurus iriomotensis]
MTDGLPVPRQLPADPASFVGRETDLAALDSLLTKSGNARAVVISAIAGSGGVGKTTLAVHWAHQIREHFPDGDLFVNLRGYDSGQPMTPKQALDGFLRALDVPSEKIPPELDVQAALFRSLLNGRRMLVVLDNAASVEQVRPLLPGTAGCFTLITSRSHLSGLAAREGVGRVPIDVLSPEHAVDLLRQVIGDSRIDAEPDMTAELARRCGYLPLALRIAADRAVTHPHLMLSDLVEELVDERDLLDALASDDDETTAIRTVFSWSYKKLPPDAARTFRLLALNAGPDLSGEAAAALTGSTGPRVRRLLDTLTSQHLLEQTRRNRYRFHDLLRVYAAERATLDESEAERTVAVRRMLDWYVHTALRARRVIQPNVYEVSIDPVDPSYPPLDFSTHDEALEWYEQERTNLVIAVRQAAEVGYEPAAWKLTIVLIPFFSLRWDLDEWLGSLQLGLGAARRLGDQNAEALILLELGDLHWELRHFDEAIDHHQRALPLSQNAGTWWTEGFCHHGLACSYRDLNRPDKAVPHFQRA